MRILITSIIDLKKSQHNRPHQFVKYLSKKHDVTVLSINDWWKGGQNDLESYSVDFSAEFDRINYIYLTTKKISPILQEVLFHEKVREVVREGFDIHLNYNTLISGYIASRSIKTVYDIADDLSAMIKQSPQIPRLLRPFGGMLGKIMIHKNIENSELVTVTTEELMESYSIPESKCKVLPNGVNTEIFKNDISAKEKLGFDGFVIGYVGVLREWVDFEPVFSALKEINFEIKMVIVGKEGNFEETVKLAQKCGVSDRVIFTGMIPYSKVPLYISAMDVCLIPFSKGAISQNALPLKLFEYMACEKVVVSTNLPAVKKVAGETIMYADSANEYKDTFLKLYKNEKLRSDLGIAGRKLIEDGYDWNKIAGRLETLLFETSVKSN